VTQPLIQLRNCDVFLERQQVLHDVTWQLRSTENWAFWGGNGAGKSTLLKLIRGALWPHFARGSRFYRFDDRITSSPIRAREQIAWVSGAQHEKYRRQEWQIDGREVVMSGYFDSELLHQKPTPEQRQHAEDLTSELGISALLERDYHTLSHGELRRLLIARALVRRPRVLLLDEACSGLDANSRVQMLAFIETLATREVQLLVATHRRDEIVPGITHVAHLEEGHIIAQGHREEILPGEKRHIEYSMPEIVSSPQRFQTLIKIVNTDVFRDENKVLHNINWVWHSGEHWRVRGANGSGKSTFLKLLAGDLWPARGGKVERFDNTPFADIWQMKQRIGIVSPELQERHEEDVVGFEVVASGYFGFVGVSGHLSDSQLQHVDDTLTGCGIAHLRDKPITQMSSGEARKVLLARALINNPDILLLDEPCDSLDEYSIADFKQLLGIAVNTGTHVLLISHHDEDTLPFLTHEMTLDNGRVIAQVAL
jgi:molybdate transport system ATP-binding protein